jgi:hypothetical protein
MIFLVLIGGSLTRSQQQECQEWTKIVCATKSNTFVTPLEYSWGFKKKGVKTSFFWETHNYVT